eukprot:11658178-Prorocentrum_lima.AAC.1
MDGIVPDYELISNILMHELSEPVLRNPRNLAAVASFISIMLGEVRIRSHEERTAKASRKVRA